MKRLYILCAVALLLIGMTSSAGVIQIPSAEASGMSLVVASGSTPAEEPGGGTYPTVIAYATTEGYGNMLTEYVTVTHGFSLSNGDVLYAFLGEGDDTGTGWSDTATAWTVLANDANSSGSDTSIGILRKVISDAGSEPSSYSFIRSGGGIDTYVAMIVQVRDANTTTPEDQTTQVSARVDNDFTPDNVDITTQTADALVICAHVASEASGQYSGANERTAGAPSGYTLIGSEVYDSGQSYALFLAVAKLEESGSAGSKSIGVWTHTADDAISEGFTMAVAVAPE